MNGSHDQGSFARVHRARRAPSPSRRAHHVPLAGRRRAGANTDEGALALLSDVLIGDSHWTMPELQRLIALRERSQAGRWSVGAPDDGAPDPDGAGLR